MNSGRESQRTRSVRVGIIDSGADDGLDPPPLQHQGFMLQTDHTITRRPMQPDALGHGSAVSQTVRRYAPQADLLIAQVFDASGRTSTLQIAVALDWLRMEQADIVCMSLGVRDDRPRLAQAVGDALAQHMLLCASTPARGEPVYPAAYPGVLRVTGDARCDAHEWSWLGTAQADFGAAVRQHRSGPAGASMANAALCGHLAAQLHEQPSLSPASQLRLLHQRARIKGAQTPPPLKNHSCNE